MQNFGTPRQMYNIASLGIKCATCGADITELPFQPSKRDDGTYGQLYCRDCNRNRRKSFGRDR